MTRFTVEPPSDPSIRTWYVKDTLVPGGCSPFIAAICNSQRQAKILAGALEAYYAAAERSRRRKRSAR